MSHYSSIKSIAIRVPTHSLQTPLSRSHNSDYRGSTASRLRSHHVTTNLSSSNLLRSQQKSASRSCSNSRCQSLRQSRSSAFKPCKGSQKYMKQLLEKAFSKSLELVKAGEVLTHTNIVDIFCYLGLFSDPPSKKDLGAAQKISNILDKQGKGIRRRNLLKLVLIISRVPVDRETTQPTDNPSSGLRRDTEQQVSCDQNLSVGSFNEFDVWMTTQQDEKLIELELGHLYFNKISNENVKYIRNPDVQEHSFKPRILSSSSEKGLRHRRRVLSCVSSGEIKELKSTEDILILHQKLHEIKVKQNSMSLRKKETQLCTFKPSINKSSAISKCMQMGSRQPHPTQQHKPPTSTQMRELKEMKECSFRPKLYRHKENVQTPVVKNQLKIINRMKQAYAKRVIANTIKERGYPKETNWHSFVTNTKKGKKEKKPVLSIDIKIGNQMEVLHIFEGECLENLVCKILVKNKLPYEYQNNVESLLREVLEESPAICLHDGFISAK